MKLRSPPLLGVILKQGAPRSRVDVDAPGEILTDRIDEAFRFALAVEVFSLMRTTRELAPTSTVPAIGSLFDTGLTPPTSAS